MPLDAAFVTRVTRMRVGGRLYPIDSYEHASAMFRTALESWAGPQDEVPRPALCDEDGRELGYVSHSGRCWIGHSDDSQATCVYVP